MVRSSALPLLPISSADQDPSPLQRCTECARLSSTITGTSSSSGNENSSRRRPHMVRSRLMRPYRALQRWETASRDPRSSGIELGRRRLSRRSRLSLPSLYPHRRSVAVSVRLSFFPSLLSSLTIARTVWPSSLAHPNRSCDCAPSSATLSSSSHRLCETLPPPTPKANNQRFFLPTIFLDQQPTPPPSPPKEAKPASTLVRRAGQAHEE